ncbi:MAG: isoprenylcysteine carboxylmethyltransferase family protein [Gammaproteobacteria bacterium]|nr:isoprenylcysteine carboxylmethyltransferase family protein [Gammaproteobacteria bacterium]MDH3372142.1 isoprenylcysteine carboxylmethyltransferase family protein [Gammaproteobacteria bacterium]MDH3408839.1 isoprenylcysteine carboxylmethyltransferase family protein [Gammaproteobacteria bacterium]MDH3551533.1 isoprenylcysteine carboxylmethyltransferase family protein [Gammaproteobacteria bacterium]
MNVRERVIDLMYRTATGTKKKRTLLTPVGVTVFGLFTALFVFLALLLDAVLALRWPIPDTVSLLVSIPMIAIGIAMTAWSVFHFLRVNGTPVPFNPPPTLVESGPYKYARNPMLTGVFLLLFGIGFAIGSPSLVLIFTPLYVLANVWELKKIEEPELIRRLGERYLSYRNRTPMFIPGPRLRR